MSPGSRLSRGRNRGTMGGALRLPIRPPMAYGAARPGRADRAGRAERPADACRSRISSPAPIRPPSAAARADRGGARCRDARRPDALGPAARSCRKTGEYAESMAIAVIDRARRHRARGGRRAADGAPVLLTGRSAGGAGGRRSRRSCQEIVLQRACRKRCSPRRGSSVHSNVALRAIEDDACA